MTKAQEIAKWIMEKSVNNTREGNWITYYDEIEERFGVCLVPGDQLEADIVAALHEVYHNVILDMTYGLRGNPSAPCFDIDLGLAYCPNYVWHDGDEEIFESYEEFENRAIMPLPLERGIKMEPMKVYVITGECDGIQDRCMVFLIKRCAIEKFEELTGCSWQEYLDGNYEYTPGEYFYRFFECEQEDYGEAPDDGEPV